MGKVFRGGGAEEMFFQLGRHGTAFKEVNEDGALAERQRDERKKILNPGRKKERNLLSRKAALPWEKAWGKAQFL